VTCLVVIKLCTLKCRAARLKFGICLRSLHTISRPQVLYEGCRTYGTRAHNGARKGSEARGIHCCPISSNFFSPTTVATLRRTICVHIQMCDSVQTVYQLPLQPNNTAVINIFTAIWAVRSVHWIFIVVAPVWRWPDRYVTLGRTFYCLLLNSKWQQQQHSYCHLLLLIAFLERTFIGNTVMLLCANCTVTVCIDSNDNGMIGSNCGRLQDPILLYKTPIGARKNFFEIYRHFWDAPSKRFASRGLVPDPWSQKHRRSDGRHIRLPMFTS